MSLSSRGRILPQPLTRVILTQPDESASDRKHGGHADVAWSQLDAVGDRRPTRVAAVLLQVDRLLRECVHPERPEETRDPEEDLLLSDGRAGTDAAATRIASGRGGIRGAACTHPAPKAQWSRFAGFARLAESAALSVSSRYLSG